MQVMDYLIHFWYVFFLCIPIAYLIYKVNKNQPVMNMTLEKTIAIIEALIYILLLYLIQVYIFKDTLFFIISAPIWIILFGIIIYILLSGNDIYILESTIQMEHFYNLGTIEKLIAPETRQRLLIMDRATYDTKQHIGDSHYTLWGGSRRIKFTDYYDEKAGVFYHPEVPELHNISFYIAKSFWLQLKEDMPKVIRTNVELTWLSDYKLAHEQRVTQDNFEFLLKNLKDQYTHEPFCLGHDIEEIYRKLLKEKLKALLESEEANQIKPKEEAVKPEPVAPAKPEEAP